MALSFGCVDVTTGFAWRYRSAWPARRESAAMTETESHEKVTRIPHRSNEPVMMVAGMRSGDIIGLCRTGFRKALTAF
jgi:hypothetical protein